MRDYHPSSTPKAERAMFVRLDLASSDYAHIEACVVRKSIKQRTNPDTGKVEYNDGDDARGYQYCTWSSNKDSALFVEDLVLRNQINRMDKDRRPYGTSIEYRRPYDVNLKTAEHMFKTLKKIASSNAKLDQQFGYAHDDFAVNLTRLASILGITKFLIEKKKVRDIHKAASPYFAEEACDAVSAKDVAWYINEMIKESQGIID